MLQTGVRTWQFNTRWTRITRETGWLKPSEMSHFLRVTCRIHLLFSVQNARNWQCTASLKHTVLLSMFFTITSYSHKWRCTDTLTAKAQFVVCLATVQALVFNFQLSEFYLITTILSNYHVQDVSANNSGSDLNTSSSQVFLLLWQVAEEL
jgi:hypothetical protein